MGFNIVEHRKELLFTRPPKIDGELDNKEFEKYCSIVPRLFPNRKKKHLPCFKLQVETDSVHLAADYYVGVDWLIKDVRSVHVLPKLNTKVIGSFEENLDKEQEEEIFNILDEEIKVNEADLKELNYLKIFMDAMAHPVIAKHIDGLIFIDWDTTEIKIEQKNDILTPFLVVQFLNLLKQIVRKGLKKSY